MKIDAVQVQIEMARQGLTVADLAHKAGLLDETLWSALLAGKARFSTVKKICAALNVSYFDVIRR